MIKWIQIKDGESYVIPIKWLKGSAEFVGKADPIKHGCCECGLVHDIKFEIYKNKLIIRLWKNDKDTILTRKQKFNGWKTKDTLDWVPPP